MAPTREPPPRSQRPIVPRWVGVVFPLVILAAIGFAVTYQLNIVNAVFLPIAVVLAAAAGMGLVAGFTVRWTLGQRAFALRALAALAALVVGLLMLGLVTRGSAGIGPFRLPLERVDWLGVVQLVLAAVVAWMTLLAWQPRAEAGQPLWQRPGAWGQAVRDRARARWEDSALRRTLSRPAPAPEPARPERVTAPEPPRAEPAPRAVRHRAEPAARAEPAGSLLDRFRSRLPRPGASRSTARPRRPSSNHRAKVRFSGKVEHRCPYCLEAVQPNDPRGVTVCPICRTQHHADCWAVTGMCQVPHHHPENH